MSETIHRRDITSGDFRILAKFCGALKNLQDNNDELLWYLPLATMYLPVWYKSCGKWHLSRYKEFKMEAIGIQTSDFRRICRYMGVKEHIVINTLYRMSILSVACKQSTCENPKFRKEFVALPYSLDGEPQWHIGFVLEMRRCEGAFRGFRNDDYWYSDDGYHTLR